LDRDRRFESSSLQQTVGLSPDFSFLCRLPAVRVVLTSPVRLCRPCRLAGAAHTAATAGFSLSCKALPFPTPGEIMLFRAGEPDRWKFARLSAGGEWIRTCMGLFLSSSSFGLLSVLCSERESRSSFRRGDQVRGAGRKGSRDRNGSKAWRLAAGSVGVMPKPT
jgi:hypothetical protein